jgi:hypothetical protein
VELDEVAAINLFDFMDTVQHASHFDVVVYGQVINLDSHTSKVLHGVPFIVGSL